MNSSVHTLNLRSIEACCHGTISFRPNVQRHICFTPRNATALWPGRPCFLMPLFPSIQESILKRINDHHRIALIARLLILFQIFIVIIKEFKKLFPRADTMKKELQEKCFPSEISRVIIRSSSKSILPYTNNIYDDAEI